MADRKVHYEAAFEAFLRGRAIPYVAVDEAKKAIFRNATLKSFDFVVYSKNGSNLLVDVKGRQARARQGAVSLQTWATEQDVADLIQWQQVFGEGYKSIFAFVYWIDPPVVPDKGMFTHQDRWYLMLGVELPEYQASMRRRSAEWQTVAVPAAEFRSLARPIECWL